MNDEAQLTFWLCPDPDGYNGHGIEVVSASGYKMCGVCWLPLEERRHHDEAVAVERRTTAHTADVPPTEELAVNTPEATL